MKKSEKEVKELMEDLVKQLAIVKKCMEELHKPYKEIRPPEDSRKAKFQVKFWIPIYPSAMKMGDDGLEDEIHVTPEDVIPFLGKMADDFNEANMAQYLIGYGHHPHLKDKVVRLKMGNKLVDSGVIVTADCLCKLTKKEIDDVVDELTGQCSDGWGEGFEQHEVGMFQGTELYISTWKHGGPNVRFYEK